MTARWSGCKPLKRIEERQSWDEFTRNRFTGGQCGTYRGLGVHEVAGAREHAGDDPAIFDVLRNCFVTPD
jgi:hypothetical protein